MVVDTTKEQSVGVVVSDQALYEVADDSAGAPPEVRRWDFREIHSVHKLEKNLVRVFLISVSAHGKVSKEKVCCVCCVVCCVLCVACCVVRVCSHGAGCR